MMEIATALRKAYFKIITENILEPGTATPIGVYDTFAPVSASYPYVVISSIDSSQISVKNSYIYNAFISMQVVTGFMQNEGRDQSEQISYDIKNLLLTLDFREIDLTAYGYQSGDTQISSNKNFADRREGLYIYRQITTYKHLINKI